MSRENVSLMQEHAHRINAAIEDAQYMYLNSLICAGQRAIVMVAALSDMPEQVQRYALYIAGWEV